MMLEPEFTGVFGVAQPENTLQAALKLQPRTRHVFVTGGVGGFDRNWEAIAKNPFVATNQGLSLPSTKPRHAITARTLKTPAR